MIYVILLIIFIIILATIKLTLNRHYGKISDNPLRKKIVDDTTNIILFAIVFWGLLKTHSKIVSVTSLLITCFALLLLLRRRHIKKILLYAVDKLREKIAFSAKLGDLMKRAMKNWKVLPSSTPSKTSDYRSSYVYREHIMLTIIFFCKRAIIMAIILLGILKITEISNPNALQILLDQSELHLTAIADLLVFINNIGLVFTCWKFKCDYTASESEEDDDARYITLVKRMLRNEHEI